MMLRRRAVALYLGVAAAGAAGAVYWGQAVFPSGFSDLEELASFYVMLLNAQVFFWIGGIPLLLYLLEVGWGLLERENRSGLTALVISKAVGRRQLLFAQWSSMMTITLALSAGGLFLGIAVLAYGASLDGAVVLALWRKIPGYFLYFLFESFVMVSLILATVHIWQKLWQRIVLLGVFGALWLGIPGWILWPYRSEGFLAMLAAAPGNGSGWQINLDTFRNFVLDFPNLQGLILYGLTAVLLLAAIISLWRTAIRLTNKDF